MTWLLWQQQRRQILAVALALVVVAVFLGITGAQLAGTYSAAVRSCASSPGGCGNLSQTLFQGDNRLFDIVDATGFLLPFVLGLFWGAPLVAKEVEEGTHRLAWTQSVTRLGWLAVKLGFVLGGAVACAGALSALMTWWYSPVNAVQLNRLGSVIFDTQGLVPVGYSLFAVALGATAGVLVRRTLPAMATTLVTFGVVRYVVDEYLRPHLLPAKSLLVNMTTAFGNNPAGVGSWVLGGSYLNGAGKVLPRDKLNPGDIPEACRQVYYSNDALGRCLSSHGFHALVSYQPAGRYWPLQGIETAIYVVAAAALIAVSCWWLARRDA